MANESKPSQLEPSRCKECESTKGFTMIAKDPETLAEIWECSACGAIDSNQPLQEDDPREPR